MRKTILYLVSFMAVITLLTGCSAIGGNNSSKVSRNGPAIIPPQTDGTIKSIQSGNPSYVILNDVTIINKDHVQIHKSMLKVELPNGHFISPVPAHVPWPHLPQLRWPHKLPLHCGRIATGNKKRDWISLTSEKISLVFNLSLKFALNDHSHKVIVHQG